MFDLSNPFIMPETVMLRTQEEHIAIIGGCHMAVPKPECEEHYFAMGGCHMAVPEPSLCRKNPLYEASHRVSVSLS